jgi:hypothetical protein
LTELLVHRGHGPGLIHQYVRAVEHFGHWLGAGYPAVAVEEVTTASVRQFLREHLPHCGCTASFPRGRATPSPAAACWPGTARAPTSTGPSTSSRPTWAAGLPRLLSRSPLLPLGLRFRLLRVRLPRRSVGGEYFVTLLSSSHCRKVLKRPRCTEPSPAGPLRRRERRA